jgi:hypothetical protein
VSRVVVAQVATSSSETRAPLLWESLSLGALTGHPSRTRQRLDPT